MIKKLKCDLRTRGLSFHPHLKNCACPVHGISTSEARHVHRSAPVYPRWSSVFDSGGLRHCYTVGIHAADQGNVRCARCMRCRGILECRFSLRHQRCGEARQSSDPDHAHKSQGECTKLVDFASPQGELEPHWTLEITSPTSGGTSSCTLQLPTLSDMPTPLWSIIEEVLSLAIHTYPREANEFLDLMIGMLEQVRTRLAETASE
jgi:hypothetical protein